MTVENNQERIELMGYCRHGEHIIPLVASSTGYTPDRVESQRIHVLIGYAIADETSNIDRIVFENNDSTAHMFNHGWVEERLQEWVDDPNNENRQIIGPITRSWHKGLITIGWRIHAEHN